MHRRRRLWRALFYSPSTPASLHRSGERLSSRTPASQTTVRKNQCKHENAHSYAPLSFTGLFLPPPLPGLIKSIRFSQAASAFPRPYLNSQHATPIAGLYKTSQPFDCTVTCAHVSCTAVCAQLACSQYSTYTQMTTTTTTTKL